MNSQGRSRTRTEPVRNDIIWQNCSKYSSHAEILIVHMGIIVSSASQTRRNNTFAVPVIVALSTHSQWLQHADNTCCVRNTRWGGINKKFRVKNWAILCAAGNVVLSGIFNIKPRVCPPYLVKVNKTSLSLGTRCASTPNWEQKRPLFNPTIIHLVERTLFLRYFNFREISNDFFQ